MSYWETLIGFDSIHFYMLREAVRTILEFYILRYDLYVFPIGLGPSRYQHGQRAGIQE